MSYDSDSMHDLSVLRGSLNVGDREKQAEELSADDALSADYEYDFSVFGNTYNERLSEFWYSSSVFNSRLLVDACVLDPVVKLYDFRFVVENPSVAFRQNANDGVYDDIADEDYMDVLKRIETIDSFFNGKRYLPLSVYYVLVVARIHAFVNDVSLQEHAISELKDFILEQIGVLLDTPFGK